MAPKPAPDHSRYERERRLAREQQKPSNGPSARSGQMNLPTEERKLDRLEDETRELYKNPTTGRNTKLGKKVEKPRDPKSGGPSGQTERAKHDKRHANK